MSKLWYNFNSPVTAINPDTSYLKDILPIDFSKSNYRLFVVKDNVIFTDEFLNFLEDLGLKSIGNLIVFACKQGTSGILHKDFYPDGKWGHVAINFHLTSTYGNLEWFEDTESEILTSEINTVYDHHTSGGILIDQWSGPCPALIRSDVAHMANNSNESDTRITATIRFQQNPEWDFVVDKLRDYLYE